MLCHAGPANYRKPWPPEQRANRRSAAAGITDAKIIEVVAHVASQTLTNYLNNLALTEIDFPAIDA